MLKYFHSLTLSLVSVLCGLSLALCAGTGGIVDREDWRDIDWQPLFALIGGTQQFPRGLHLTPWFLKGFKGPTLPGVNAICWQVG